jgi:hypothetical protein
MLRWAQVPMRSIGAGFAIKCDDDDRQDDVCHRPREPDKIRPAMTATKDAVMI